MFITYNVGCISLNLTTTQLEMAKSELVEEVCVNLFGVHSSAREPPANSDLRGVEQQGRIGEGQTQVDGQEDLSGRDAETIQVAGLCRGIIFSSCSEGHMVLRGDIFTGLT